MPKNTIPSPPWLDSPEQIIWSRLAEEVAADEASHRALAVYCWVLPRWKRAREDAARVESAGGGTWIAADGHRHPHPVFDLEARLADVLCSLGDALGLEHPAPRSTEPTRIFLLDDNGA